MGAVPVAALFFLVMAVCDATRKKRVAAGSPVESPSQYPWIVFIKSVYKYMKKTDKIWARCAKGCTGSFIDVFGSVITAAHCVRRYTNCTDNTGENRTCELSYVRVTWGVVSPTPNANTMEQVPNVEDRIIRFEEPAEEEEERFLKVDVALIYLSTFHTTSMTCRSRSIPRPINIDPTNYSPDWSEVGIFAGFGVQPTGYESENNSYCYANAGHLSEIHVRYDDLFVPTKLCRSQHCYNGYAEIYERPPNNDLRHSQVGGTCQGDSGGPYMVKEYGGAERMILRGTLIGGPNYNRNRTHSCSGFFDPNYFVEVSSEEVRGWLLEMLTVRYGYEDFHYSQIPEACQEL